MRDRPVLSAAGQLFLSIQTRERSGIVGRIRGRETITNAAKEQDKRRREEKSRSPFSPPPGSAPNERGERQQGGLTKRLPVFPRARAPARPIKGTRQNAGNVTGFAGAFPDRLEVDTERRGAKLLLQSSRWVAARRSVLRGNEASC
jgi:hypothetical protein